MSCQLVDVIYNYAGTADDQASGQRFAYAGASARYYNAASHY